MNVMSEINWMSTDCLPSPTIALESRRNPLAFLILMDGPLQFNILLMELASSLLLNPTDQEITTCKQDFSATVDILSSFPLKSLQFLCFILWLQPILFHFVTLKAIQLLLVIAIYVLSWM